MLKSSAILTGANNQSWVNSHDHTFELLGSFSRQWRWVSDRDDLVEFKEPFIFECNAGIFEIGDIHMTEQIQKTLNNLYISKAFNIPDSARVEILEMYWSFMRAAGVYRGTRTAGGISCNNPEWTALTAVFFDHVVSDLKFQLLLDGDCPDDLMVEGGR